MCFGSNVTYCMQGFDVILGSERRNMSTAILPYTVTVPAYALASKYLDPIGARPEISQITDGTSP